MVVNIPQKTGELSNWVRGFAKEALPVCMNSSAEMVRGAIATHLPEKLAEVSTEATLEELLEQVLGISTIVQYGRERIGWLATTDPAEADMLRQRYSSTPYSEARQDIGIDGHWIFLVDSELLDIYGVDELMSSGPYSIEMYEMYPELLRLEDRQECVIVSL